MIRQFKMPKTPTAEHQLISDIVSAINSYTNKKPPTDNDNYNPLDGVRHTVDINGLILVQLQFVTDQITSFNQSLLEILNDTYVETHDTLGKR